MQDDGDNAFGTIPDADEFDIIPPIPGELDEGGDDPFAPIPAIDEDGDVSFSPIPAIGDDDEVVFSPVPGDDAFPPVPRDIFSGQLNSEEMAWVARETSDLCKLELTRNAIKLTLAESLSSLVKSPSYVLRMEKMLHHTEELEKKFANSLKASRLSSQETAGSLSFEALLTGINAPPEEMASLHMNKLISAGLMAAERTNLDEVKYSGVSVAGIEAIDYFEISDHLRECIPAVRDTGLRKRDDPNYKTLVDPQKNEVSEAPCANGELCWAFTNFQVVLRRCKNQYCELCHWHIVNTRKMINILSTVPVKFIYQLHRFKVDQTPVLHGNELVPSFSQTIMDPPNSDMLFDGVFPHFPRIGVDMFVRADVQKNVLVNQTTGQTRTFTVRGLRLAS